MPLVINVLQGAAADACCARAAKLGRYPRALFFALYSISVANLQIMQERSLHSFLCESCRNGYLETDGQLKC